MGSFRRPDDLLFCGIRLTHTDIVTDGAGTQPGLLQYHTIIGTEASSGDVPDIGAVHFNGAGVHIVETHQQIDDGGLTASGRTYDSNSLPGFYLQVKVLDQLLLRYILEIYILQFYVALSLF